jgi:hypothetical protein
VVCLNAHVLATYCVTAQSGTCVDLALIPKWLARIKAEEPCRLIDGKVSCWTNADAKWPRRSLPRSKEYRR